jgi:hypothetical protein
LGSTVSLSIGLTKKKASDTQACTPTLVAAEVHQQLSLQFGFAALLNQALGKECKYIVLKRLSNLEGLNVLFILK